MADKTLTVNGQPFTFNRDKFAGVRTMTVNGQTVTVDRTATVKSERVGESSPLLSKVVGGASAAYSLRDLNDKAGNNKVVRVRRESDNHERDFLAKEVANGTLTNWVNSQTVLPLDIQALTSEGRTGSVSPASAAYSLRNLRKDYTGATYNFGNVIQAQRITDKAYSYFSANELSDGTLEAFAKQKAIYFDTTGTSVKNVTYYDRSYNVIDSSFPVTFSSTGGFNNTEKYAFTGEGDSNGFGQNFYFNKSMHTTRIGVSHANKKVTVEGYVRRTNGNAGNSLYIRAYAKTANQHKFSVTNLVQDVWTFFSGTIDTAGSSMNHIQFGCDDGIDFELSNIKFSVENNDLGVLTWNDQSGNGNHATQSNVARQPKIVTGGSLVKDSAGLPEIDFLGGSASFSNFLNVDFGSDLSQPNSIFMVHESDSTSDTDNEFFDEIGTANSSVNRTLFDAGSENYRPYAGITVNTNVDVVANTKAVATAIYDGADSILAINGTATSISSSIGTNSIFRTSTIGFSEGTDNYYDGTMQEFIVYNSNQSDNRDAIEANIAEHYNISDINTAINQVNGFVETWYDQSGYGHDATQSTITNQPKIVDGGVLVKRTINGVSSPSVKFTASNSMTHGLTSLSADGQQSLFFVADNQITSGASHRLIEIMSNTSDEADKRRPLIFQNNTNGMTFSVDSLSGFVRTTSQSNFLSLYSSITNDSAGGTHTVHQDGSQFGSTSVTLNANSSISVSDRGLGEIPSDAVGTFFFTEVIYYPSDQSANRPAIEANIKNQYNIT